MEFAKLVISLSFAILFAEMITSTRCGVIRKSFRKRYIPKHHLKHRLRREARERFDHHGKRSTSTEEPSKTFITIAVLLPEQGDYLFKRAIVQPGIEYALNTIRNTPEMLPSNYDFELKYYDSKCSRQAALSAVDAYYNEPIKGEEITNRNCKNSHDTPFVLLGPVCNSATAIVATFAEKWNVPLITAGAPAGYMTPIEYPTLTRVTSTHMDIAYFIRSLFRSLGYGTQVPVTLIYEDFYEGKTTDSECQYLMQALYSAFNQEEDTFIIGPYTIGSHMIDEDNFVRQLHSTKVVLMCGASDIIRRLMLAAHRNGQTDPTRNVWVTVDMHNSSHYAGGGWRRGDENDHVAKEAYRALQVVSLHVNNSAKFQHFSDAMNDVYRANGVPDVEDRLVNEYVEGFHDSLLLYAHALKEVVANGGDVKNGTEITRHMRNVSIPGIAGQIVMDKDGDRHGDFSILAMKNYSSGVFESVYDYFGSLGMILPKGLPRINLTMERDHQFIKISKDSPKLKRNRILGIEDMERTLTGSSSRNELLAALFGTIGGVIICCVLVVGPVCYQKKKRGVRAFTTGSENGLMVAEPYFSGAEMCIQQPLRDEGSVTTCNTTLDDDQKL